VAEVVGVGRLELEDRVEIAWQYQSYATEARSHIDGVLTGTSQLDRHLAGTGVRYDGSRCGTNVDIAATGVRVDFTG
jgi:hypothetical protein